jgi:hypothetical protein
MLTDVVAHHRHLRQRSPENEPWSFRGPGLPDRMHECHCYWVGDILGCCVCCQWLMTCNILVRGVGDRIRGDCCYCCYCSFGIGFLTCSAGAHGGRRYFHALLRRQLLLLLLLLCCQAALLCPPGKSEGRHAAKYRSTTKKSGPAIISLAFVV